MDSSPIQIVQEVYESFRQRDLAKIFSLLSPEVELEQSTELPWGGTYRGHDGTQQFFSKLLSYVNSKVIMDRFVHAADDVVAIGWTEGTVNATGASFRVPIAHVWTVKNGKAVRIHFFIDHPTMFAALEK